MVFFRLITAWGDTIHARRYDSVDDRPRRSEPMFDDAILLRGS